LNLQVYAFIAVFSPFPFADQREDMDRRPPCSNMKCEDDSIFAACDRCNVLLCYTHIMDDDDCNNHNPFASLIFPGTKEQTVSITVSLPAQVANDMLEISAPAPLMMPTQPFVLPTDDPEFDVGLPALPTDFSPPALPTDLCPPALPTYFPPPALPTNFPQPALPTDMPNPATSVMVSSQTTGMSIPSISSIASRPEDFVVEGGEPEMEFQGTNNKVNMFKDNKRKSNSGETYTSNSTGKVMKGRKEEDKPRCHGHPACLWGKDFNASQLLT
jgi:hypothetical protein